MFTRLIADGNGGNKSVPPPQTAAAVLPRPFAESCGNSYKEMRKMANKNVVPEARQALDKFKMEAASEVGVTLNQGYNGDLTSRQAGSVGGQMVKKMIEKYENDIKNSK